MCKSTHHLLEHSCRSGGAFGTHLLLAQCHCSQFVAGDEYGQTRDGNNNWYGHDTRMTRFEWDELEKKRDTFFRFYRSACHSCPLHFPSSSWCLCWLCLAHVTQKMVKYSSYSPDCAGALVRCGAVTACAQQTIYMNVQNMWDVWARACCCQKHMLALKMDKGRAMIIKDGPIWPTLGESVEDQAVWL